MIGLRKVTYGNSYEFTYTHDCDDAYKHSYTVDVDTFLKDAAIDPVAFIESHKFALPSTGQVITFQPMKFKNVVDLMNASVEERSQENTSLMPITDPFAKQRKYFKSLLSSIGNVDGITDRDLIIEWLDALTAPDVTAILTKLDEISSWGPKYIATVTCKDCGDIIDISVPVNPLNFFI
jgi:hypothetical protein